MSASKEPGEHPACVAEQQERSELVSAIGQLTGEVSSLSGEIGKPPNELLPLSDPDRNGTGLKRLILETKRTAEQTQEAVAELCVDFAELKDSLMPDSKKRSERRKAQLALVGAVLAAVVATGSIIGGCVSVASSVAKHVRVEVTR